MLARLGLGGLMPGYQPQSPPAPDLPLSTPSRHVPLSYRLLLLPWSTWTVFAPFMVAVSPIAVWIFWPVARGWQVTRRFYSGPGTKTKVRYQLNGTPGELTLRGREYIDGAILVNSRTPQIAACVTSVPFDLSERTPSGDWTGTVRTGTIIGAVAMFVFVVGWTAVLLYLTGTSAASMDQLPFFG